ncbi:hypothetical protein ACQEVC_26730 [Plantactinospora sp. CA-294935]|uniref:hypothetical protein n=1 Tax=Plantactinospora sp. CA-294935 TaxID=3240012 RepID=UPI003D94866A
MTARDSVDSPRPIDVGKLSVPARAVPGTDRRLQDRCTTSAAARSARRYADDRDVHDLGGGAAGSGYAYDRDVHDFGGGPAGSAVRLRS